MDKWLGLKEMSTIRKGGSSWEIAMRGRFPFLKTCCNFLGVTIASRPCKVLHFQASRLTTSMHLGG